MIREAGQLCVAGGFGCIDCPDYLMSGNAWPMIMIMSYSEKTKLRKSLLDGG